MQICDGRLSETEREIVQSWYSRLIQNTAQESANTDEGKRGGGEAKSVEGSGLTWLLVPLHLYS
jgi:hypothetical protein